MRRSFVLGAMLSVAALIFGVPAVVGQTSGAAGQPGMYEGSSSQYGQIGPYAQEMGYGTFGAYGSPDIPEYTYRSYWHIPGARGPYAYMGYPRYTYQAPSYEGQRYWQYPGWQGYRGYYGWQGYYPSYEERGYSRGYYGQPGWRGWGTWRGYGYQPYGYSGYEQQRYLNRGRYYQGSSCVGCYQGSVCPGCYPSGWSQSWYGQPSTYYWSGCRGPSCHQRYGTVGYRSCDEYGRPCYNRLNPYNGAIPHEEWEM
jgi:hypothetical protein